MRLESFEKGFCKLGETLVIYGYVRHNSTVKVSYPKETLDKIRMDLELARRFSVEVLDKDTKLQSIQVALGGVNWTFLQDDEE